MKLVSELLPEPEDPTPIFILFLFLLFPLFCFLRFPSAHFFGCLFFVCLFFSVRRAGRSLFLLGGCKKTDPVGVGQGLVVDLFSPTNLGFGV